MTRSEIRSMIALEMANEAKRLLNERRSTRHAEVTAAISCACAAMDIEPAFAALGDATEDEGRERYAPIVKAMAGRIVDKHGAA